MVKIYAKLTLITKFHAWSFYNEDTINARSALFNLDHLYLMKNEDLFFIDKKKKIINEINNEFVLSESKLDAAISSLQDEIKVNGAMILPGTKSQIIEASLSCLTETRKIIPVEVDIIWSHPLGWRLVSLFNKSQYFTVAAFFAKNNGDVSSKSMRNYYKAMMNRPLTHAISKALVLSGNFLKEYR